MPRSLVRSRSLVARVAIITLVVITAQAAGVIAETHMKEGES